MNKEISSELLVWLAFGAICILTATLVKPGWADILCHTNPHEDEALVTELGKYKMQQCTSPSNTCYESYMKKLNTKDERAFYKAGCTDIGCNKAEERCRACNTSLCNDKFADKIRAISRQCWETGSYSDFGDKTVFCFPKVTKCYLAVKYGRRSTDWHFTAGCGKLSKSLGSFHEYSECESDLCNFRGHMELVVKAKREKLPPRPARPNITDDDEDSEPLPTETPTDNPTHSTTESAQPSVEAIECYHNAGDKDYGIKTVSCSHSVAKCYYQGYEIGNNMVRYNAGCGICYKCSCKCHVCSTNLCNIPPELQNEVQQRLSQQQPVTTPKSEQTNGESSNEDGEYENNKAKNKQKEKQQKGKSHDYDDYGSSAVKTVSWIVAALPFLVVYIYLMRS